MSQPLIKIVLAGDGGCGKTTLLSTKLTGNFQISPKITIGVDFQVILHENPLTHTYQKFLVFDLGGQNRFHFIHNSFIIGAKAAIILYDLTRIQSFENIGRWIKLLHSEDENIPMILCGNKVDAVQPEDIAYFQKEWLKIQPTIPGGSNITQHLFTTSHNIDQINNLFTTTSNLIPDSQKVIC